MEQIISIVPGGIHKNHDQSTIYSKIFFEI